MPLFAILHADVACLHSGSCTLVEADSLQAIAQPMLAHPGRWKPLLHRLYPDRVVRRSLWTRLQSDTLTPEALLSLLAQTDADDDWAEVMRIQPVEVQSLDTVRVEDGGIIR